METHLSVQQLFTISVLTSLLGASTTQGIVGCGSGDVRVVNGFTPKDGRVEVCQNDSWIPVCDGGWGNNDVRVVCRQLGFEDRSVRLYISDTLFGSSSGSQYITDVRCVGSEARLVDCELVTGPLCDPQNTAIAFCTYNGAPLLYSSRQLYQNNSLINSQDVRNYAAKSILCLTDRLPCCYGADNGSWYDPSGSPLPDRTQISANTIIERFYLRYSSSQVIGLYHSIEGSGGISEGLFHCQIFDRQNATQYLYIGIYSSGNGSLMVSNVAYNSSSQTLVCTSTGGPATSVTWSRDDTPLVVDGTTYEHSQIITDTNTATYQNRLRIVHRSSQSHVYTCTVSNLRGNDTAQLVVPACEIGEVNFTTTGIINAFCCNGTWHVVPTTAKGQGINLSTIVASIANIAPTAGIVSTTVASTATIAPTASIVSTTLVSSLGTLIGILLIVIIACISIVMVLVRKSKKTAHDQQTMVCPVVSVATNPSAAEQDPAYASIIETNLAYGCAAKQDTAHLCTTEMNLAFGVKQPSELLNSAEYDTVR